ncbi:hypothetical protein D3C71_216490 [compost metagenome]
MPDFSDLVPFIDRTRWLMLQACAADGVELKTFSKKIGMSERRIRSILFSENSPIGDLNLRQIADWFYCSIGRVPEFSVVPMREWHSRERPV